MSWKKASEPPVLEVGPVTTPRDVRAQRRLRQEARPFPLDRIDELSPIGLFSFAPNRKTSRGWKAFHLPDPRPTARAEGKSDNEGP